MKRRVEPMNVDDDLRINVDDDGRVWWSSSCRLTAEQVIHGLRLVIDDHLEIVRRAALLRDAIKKQEAGK